MEISESLQSIVPTLVALFGRYCPICEATGDQLYTPRTAITWKEPRKYASRVRKTFLEIYAAMSCHEFSLESAYGCMAKAMLHSLSTDQQVNFSKVAASGVIRSFVPTKPIHPYTDSSVSDFLIHIFVFHPSISLFLKDQLIKTFSSLKEDVSLTLCAGCYQLVLSHAESLGDGANEFDTKQFKHECTKLYSEHYSLYLHSMFSKRGSNVHDVLLGLNCNIQGLPALLGDIQLSKSIAEPYSKSLGHSEPVNMLSVITNSYIDRTLLRNYLAVFRDWFRLRNASFSPDLLTGYANAGLKLFDNMTVPSVTNMSRRYHLQSFLTGSIATKSTNERSDVDISSYVSYCDGPECGSSLACGPNRCHTEMDAVVPITEDMLFDVYTSLLHLLTTDPRYSNSVFDFSKVIRKPKDQSIGLCFYDKKKQVVCSLHLCMECVARMSLLGPLYHRMLLSCMPIPGVFSTAEQMLGHYISHSLCTETLTSIGLTKFSFFNILHAVLESYEISTYLLRVFSMQLDRDSRDNRSPISVSLIAPLFFSLRTKFRNILSGTPFHLCLTEGEALLAANEMLARNSAAQSSVALQELYQSSQENPGGDRCSFHEFMDAITVDVVIAVLEKVKGFHRSVFDQSCDGLPDNPSITEVLSTPWFLTGQPYMATSLRDNVKPHDHYRIFSILEEGILFVKRFGLLPPCLYHCTDEVE